ncbi:MAG: DUF86 domain-containing protein [Bacteroidales bacterium]|jgi:uncharacterized protein with HEPN domain|nr:DUF86 domain-containing protein [Bacteroidales bacterium]
MNRDTLILQRILRHIENLKQSNIRFGNNFNAFKSDIDYFNSVCMSLLQIGELANHLSKDFIKENNKIPWSRIIGLRNVVVHGYGQLDTDLVWTTVVEDIPILQKDIEDIYNS